MNRRRFSFRWSIILPALVLGGWLAFDGIRALLMGDYVTPTTGEHVGRLGPWADLVRAAGLEPRSLLVKGLHVLLGAAWLVAGVGTIREASWGRAALRWCAVLSLWYLPWGTAIGVVVLGLLSATTVRSGTPET